MAPAVPYLRWFGLLEKEAFNRNILNIFLFLGEPLAGGIVRGGLPPRTKFLFYSRNAGEHMCTWVRLSCERV